MTIFRILIKKIIAKEYLSHLIKCVLIVAEHVILLLTVQNPKMMINSHLTRDEQKKKIFQEEKKTRGVGSEQEQVDGATLNPPAQMMHMVEAMMNKLSV